jgi:hypothetical protein
VAPYVLDFLLDGLSGILKSSDETTISSFSNSEQLEIEIESTCEIFSFSKTEITFIE